MIHWFVVNVYPTALRTLVASLIGAGVANLVVAPIRREARRLRRQGAVIQDQLNPQTPGGITALIGVMTKVEDQLDTSTPGGLTDVLDALRHLDDDDDARNDEGMDDGADPDGRARAPRLPTPRR